MGAVLVVEAQVVTFEPKMLKLQSCIDMGDEAGMVYCTEAVSFSKEKLEDLAKELKKKMPSSMSTVVEFKISEVDFIE